LGRARALTAEREQLIVEIAEEWSAALRNHPVTEEDLVELWDGLTEEAVRRLRREAKGRWSLQAIQEAASQVTLAIRERVQQALEKPHQASSQDPPGEQG
jgi:hypothetical protein